MFREGQAERAAGFRPGPGQVADQGAAWAGVSNGWLAEMTVVAPGPAFGPATAQPAATRSASCSWAARAGRPPTAATAAASRVTDTSTAPVPPATSLTATLVWTWQPATRAVRTASTQDQQGATARTRRFSGWSCRGFGHGGSSPPP